MLYGALLLFLFLARSSLSKAYVLYIWRLLLHVADNTYDIMNKAKISRATTVSFVYNHHFEVCHF